MKRVRVWFNRTFSNIYNVFRLLHASDAPVRAHVHCTHSSREFVGFATSDTCALEPSGLSESDYVAWCLAHCREREIDVFVPGRSSIAISRARADFEAMGVRVIVATAPTVAEHFDDKGAFYRDLPPDVAHAPRFESVTSAAGFTEACEKLRAEGHGVCFKPAKSMGGLGFRILDDRRTDIQNLLGGEQVRMTSALATYILSRDENFRPLLVMEYLGGAEYSVDCLAKNGQLVRAIARRKPTMIGGTQLLEDKPDLVALSERLVRHFSLDALVNIQVRYAGDTPKLLEINPRISGGIYFACLSGVNLPAWALALACEVASPEEVPLGRTGMYVHQQYHEFPFSRIERENES